eukprot:Skav222604  [mRNA]  locus=scaffold5038:118162:130242:+ [translate_table: standard]
MSPLGPPCPHDRNGNGWLPRRRRRRQEAQSVGFGQRLAPGDEAFAHRRVEAPGQNEFEELLASGDLSEEEKAKLDQEEIDFLRKKRKDRMRGNMKFIGHLFLRQLLSAKVIGSVICELVLCEQAEDLPEEHAIECACELLLAIGYTMENMVAGQAAITSVCGRLKDLMKRKLDNGKSAYCKRVQFTIQDVLDTRAAGWTRKAGPGAAVAVAWVSEYK